VPNSVVKIDARTHKIVDVIAVGRVPHEIAVAGDYVFAASKGDGTLTRVDRRTRSVVNSGKYDATSGLAWDGGARLWVGSPGRRRQVVDAGLPTDDLGLEPSAASCPFRPTP
jgi:DNA-binding beta-propeller fold protein YncE